MNEQSSQKLLSTLALLLTPKIGPVTYKKLVELHGSAEAACQAVQNDPRFPKKPCLAAAENAVLKAQRQGVRLLHMDEATYPSLLKTTSDAPPLLFIKGNLTLLSQKTIAIVGSRAASHQGCKLAYGMAKDLGERGYTVVSGYAKGIDIAAHRGAQAQGSIAVFAGGIDCVFPPEHEAYLEKFLETGLIISEMPMGLRPSSQNFPRRNRLISGLSLAVVVVEAAYQSGSLLTAQYAMEQGREIAAVPGSPLDPRCRGSNKLLKEGAYFVENSWDVLSIFEEFGKVPLRKEDKKSQSVVFPSGDLEAQILSFLSSTPIRLNELLENIQSPATDVLETLGDLELKGKVLRDAGNQVSLCL